MTFWGGSGSAYVNAANAQICNNAKKTWHSYLPDPRMASHLQSCSGFSDTRSHRSATPILPSNNKYNYQCWNSNLSGNDQSTGNSLPPPPPSHLYFELWSSFLWRIIIAWKCNRAWKENDDQIGSCFLRTPSQTSKPEFTNPSSFFSLCNIVYTLYNYDNLHFRMFACRCLWSDPCRRTSPVSKHKMTIAL